MSEALLDVRDLRTHFVTDDGVVKAVDGVSFSIAAGETVGLVGESGSGKSVTSLSILGLLPRTARHPSGVVNFGGRDLLRLPERDKRALRGNRIAMIFQDPMTSLNPFLTIGRQISEVLEVHKGASTRAAAKRACALLEQVGIADAGARAKHYPHQLSGGMRQRVMIAMALACEPALLIADEPTTALDVTIQAQILDLIRDQTRRLGTSVILVTHDLGVIAGMADRVLVMYAGRVVESAPVDNLFARPSHPYTQGLLASVPRLSNERAERLTPIGGLPPDLSALPPGCPFAPRCPRVVARCRESYPSVVQIGATHEAACWEAR